MMNLRNGKRLIICDEEEHNKKKNKREEFSKIDDALPYLPEELILENILIRLSARDLAKWSFVSKYWYNASILDDSRFAFSHFVHNKDKLNLVFNLLNVWTDGLDTKGYFLGIEEEKNTNDVDGYLLNYRYLTDITCSWSSATELVGYCNGLVCTKLVGSPTDDRGEIGIINPTRSETLSLAYLIPTSSMYLCHGFCFDSLSERYKVVIVCTTTSTITGDQEFVCMVLTLGEAGTNTWRKIATSSAQISRPPGSNSPFPGRMVTRCARSTRRSATVCGGDLLWRITNHMSDDKEMDILLSFDIHEEKIRFIRLPTECGETGITWRMGDYNHHSVVDNHLLEFKGYLCVARSEKIMESHNSRSRHRRSCHRGHRSNRDKFSYCCCGFKVDLFVLEDKVNQVWIKRESFDLHIKEKGLLPAPFCCYFDTTTASAITAYPPTRILNFSDQLILYWCDGEYLLLYNLQLKYFKVVKCSSSSEQLSRDIFETKMKNGILPGRCIGDDNNLNFPYMDYEVHAQADNILSLKTFIHEGE